MVAELAGSDRILYLKYFLLVLGGILFPSCVFIKFFGFIILTLIPNSVALHFLVWWVLILVCFPSVVKGPRGSTNPIRYKTTYICCSAALSLAFLFAGKNAYPLHRTAFLPLLSRVDTLFAVTLTHALSLVDNHVFPVTASLAHNGSLQCRVHAMGSGGMISDTRKMDKIK